MSGKKEKKGTLFDNFTIKELNVLLIKQCELENYEICDLKTKHMRAKRIRVSKPVAKLSDQNAGIFAKVLILANQNVIFKLKQ